MTKKIISVALILIPTICFGIWNKTVEMGIVFVASLFCAILLNLEELENSVYFIRTKNLEIRFKDAIEKANATIHQLNNTQYTLTKVATEILYRSKFWGGCSVKTQLEMIDELYETASSTRADRIVREPIKLAYERILSEAFGKLTNNVDDKDDKKTIDEILKKIYVFKGNTNIVTDCNSIPSGTALKGLISALGIKSDSKIRIGENIDLYESVLNKYMKIYGIIPTYDTIYWAVGKE